MRRDDVAPPTSRRGLRVRHEAAELAQAVFAAAETIPTGLRSPFVDQMRRAAASIYANIAEGEAREAPRDRLRFFTTAWASLRELDAHVDLAVNVEALRAADLGRVRSQTRHVGRMLYALRRSTANWARHPVLPHSNSA